MLFWDVKLGCDWKLVWDAKLEPRVAAVELLKLYLELQFDEMYDIPDCFDCLSQKYRNFRNYEHYSAGIVVVAAESR